MPSLCPDMPIGVLLLVLQLLNSLLQDESSMSTPRALGILLEWDASRGRFLQQNLEHDKFL